MLITWNDQYSVQVKELDQHHQKLVGMINELHEAMLVGKGKEVVSPILAKLIEYTQFHFSAEEKYMQKYSYPSYTKHKIEHDQFAAKVTDFQTQLNSGKLTLSMEVMTFLKDWLMHHISDVDKKYSPFFNEKGLQ